MVREESSSSSEFEFWMVGSSPSTDIVTADELFVDGVLLPLQKLPIVSNTGRSGIPAAPPGASSSSSSPPPAATANLRPKKWPPKKDRRGGSSSGPAELNINLWPFPRSRSASVARSSSSSSAPAASRRKVRSAPCSRSNSRGESSKAAVATTTTKWAPVASRVVAAAFVGGIRLGRTNPVWKIQKKLVNNNQQRSPPADADAEIGKTKKSGGGVRALNFQVNTCIGWRNIKDNKNRGAGGVSFFKLPAMFSFPRMSTPPPPPIPPVL